MANRHSQYSRQKGPRKQHRSAKMDSQSANNHQISLLYDNLESAEQELQNLRNALSLSNQRAEQAEVLTAQYRRISKRRFWLGEMTGFLAAVALSLIIWGIFS